MAVTIDSTWTGGAGDNLWLTDANWTPANEPNVGEDIMIPAGNWDIDATGASDLAFGELHIAPGFSGSIGTSGTPLVSSFTNLIHRGSGKLWFSANTGTTAHIIIDGTQGADLASITGANADITKISVMSGVVTYESAAGTLATLEVGANGRVILGASASAVALVNQNGGAIESARAVTVLNNCGGTYTQLQTATTAVATANLFQGSSMFVENPTTMGEVNGFGGTLDMKRNRKAGFTLSTLNPYGSFQYFKHPLVIITAENEWRS